MAPAKTRWQEGTRSASILFLLHRVGPTRYWYLEEGNVHHELLHLTISSDVSPRADKLAAPQKAALSSRSQTMSDAPW
jgi:hypothetical protein